MGSTECFIRGPGVLHNCCDGRFLRARARASVALALPVAPVEPFRAATPSEVVAGEACRRVSFQAAKRFQRQDVG